MKIQVLFFGATADATGERAKRIDVLAGANAATLVDVIASDHPALRRHKLLFAVNQQYVSANTTLNDGDELAIFTAVSGG
ncbi:MAG TPA: MoaD/ThiS family protein [Pyrinomonadaceae bacterium]|nr:MoaD/ThiS family protein [Pyrinomonadaceae bacterium]